MSCGLVNKGIFLPVLALALALAIRLELLESGRWPGIIGISSGHDGNTPPLKADDVLGSTVHPAIDDVSRDGLERSRFPGRLIELSVATSDPEKDDVERIMLLREWANANPVSMTEWVAGHLDGDEKIQALKQAAVIWAASDLEAAIRWAEALDDEEQRKVILLEVGFEAARIDPKKAVDLAGRMSPSRLRDELIVHAVRQWSSVDAAETGEWASRLPESPLRQEVLSAVAVSLSSEDGRGAAEFVAQAMVAGKEQTDASILVARKWGAQDPEEAAEWVALFPDPSVREQALQGLLAGWSGRSEQMMQAWVSWLPNSPLREEALAAISSLQRGALESTESTSELPDP
jgi:hypothetical protein